MITQDAIEAARADALAELPVRMPAIALFAHKWLQSGHTAHACFAWKLMELSGWLQVHKPKTIVELGSGLTTAVFCNYFKANEYGELNSDCRFISVEEDLGQIVYMRANLPMPYVEFVHAERIDFKLGGVEACRYNLKLPIADKIDLLYVDGPNCTIDGKTHRLGVDAAAFAEQASKPRSIMFDMRFAAMQYFSIDCDWKKHYDCLASAAVAAKLAGVPWYLSGMRHHDIFQDHN